MITSQHHTKRLASGLFDAHAVLGSWPSGVLRRNIPTRHGGYHILLARRIGELRTSTFRRDANMCQRDSFYTEIGILWSSKISQE